MIVMGYSHSGPCPEETVLLHQLSYQIHGMVYSGVCSRTTSRLWASLCFYKSTDCLQRIPKEGGYHAYVALLYLSQEFPWLFYYDNNSYFAHIAFLFIFYQLSWVCTAQLSCISSFIAVTKYLPRTNLRENIILTNHQGI